jgi:plasmid maintenance system antidote protein VapI
MSEDTNALSNVALGDSLGVSHATISRIRSGNRTPSTDLILRISKLFDWSIEEQIEAKMRQHEGVDRAYADEFARRELAAAEKLAPVVNEEPSGA